MLQKEMKGKADDGGQGKKDLPDGKVYEDGQSQGSGIGGKENPATLGAKHAAKMMMKDEKKKQSHERGGQKVEFQGRVLPELEPLETGDAAHNPGCSEKRKESEEEFEDS